MRSDIETIVVTTLQSDSTITEEQRNSVMQILRGQPEEAPQAPVMRLLKRGEVAEIIGVTPQAVDYYCRRGWLRKTVLGPQSRASGITDEALREFLRGNQIPKKNIPKNQKKRRIK